MYAKYELLSIVHPDKSNYYYYKMKKVSQCQKKLKGGPFSLVGYCMLRGKPFWFSSLGQQVQFGVFLTFCRIFGRTILVTSGVSKKKH